MATLELTNLTATPLEGGVSLAWSVNSTSYLNGFTVVTKLVSTNAVVDRKNVDANVRGTVISELEPSTAYAFVVYALHEEGAKQATVTTLASTQKEKEEREAREKEEKEAAEKAQKEKEELEAKERAEKEAREKAEREAREKAEREAKEKAEREQKEREEKEKTTTSWRGYTAKNPMPVGVVPFISTGFINQRVPTNPTVLGNSAAMVSYLGNPQDLWTDGGYDHPVYFALTTDPVLEVVVNKYGTNLTKTKIKVPTVAKPSPNTDKHITIVQPNGECFDFWETTSIGNGKIVSEGGGKGSFETGTGVCTYGGATASGFNNAAGVIRPEELAGGLIPHGLFCAVSTTRSGGHLAPATGSDGTNSNVNAPYQGQRFYLAYTDEQLAGIKPKWKRTIWTAIAHYGLWVGDSGGSGFTLKLWGPQSTTSYNLPNMFNEYLKTVTGEGGIVIETGGGGQSYTMTKLAEGVDLTKLRAISWP